MSEDVHQLTHDVLVVLFEEDEVDLRELIETTGAAHASVLESVVDLSDRDLVVREVTKTGQHVVLADHDAAESLVVDYAENRLSRRDSQKV